MVIKFIHVEHKRYEHSTFSKSLFHWPKIISHPPFDQIIGYRAKWKLESNIFSLSIKACGHLLIYHCHSPIRKLITSLWKRTKTRRNDSCFISDAELQNNPGIKRIKGMPQCIITLYRKFGSKLSLGTMGGIQENLDKMH